MTGKCVNCGNQQEVYNTKDRSVFCDKCGHKNSMSEFLPAKSNKTVSRLSPAEKRENEINAWISLNED